MDSVKNKIGYEDLQAIAVTAVDTLTKVKERCMAAEAKNEAYEKLLEEAQEAINSRDSALNRYEEKEVDPNILSKLEEVQQFLSNDIRYEEIKRKKIEDMARKQEEILRAKYNFSVRR